jgi:hypothetical protein
VQNFALVINECDFHSAAKFLGSGKNLSNSRIVFREKLKKTRASLKKLIKRLEFIRAVKTNADPKRARVGND